MNKQAFHCSRLARTLQLFAEVCSCLHFVEVSKFIDVPLLCQSMTMRVSNVEQQVATPRGRESDHPMATKCSEEIGQCRLTQTAFFDLLYKKSREAYAEKIAGLR